MNVDPSVIAALEASVEADPDRDPVRLHLIDLLLAAERWADAAVHTAVLLARRPDDTEALARAAASADGAGNREQADGYRRLLQALGHRPAGSRTGLPADVPSAPSPHPDSPPTPAVPLTQATGRDQASAGEDELDSFLRQVLDEAATDVEQPAMTLDDVGGLEEVKRRLNTSFLGPMRNPELRAMYGTSVGGGLLLYGPPGCGKTFLARAVAGELGAQFFAVGLHDVLDMWLGESERKLHAVFETARRHAPCVLFLDEIDALGLKRSNQSRSAGRNVVVQLLNELDSTRGDNEGVFVLAATNQPWDLDPALRRPGRLDRMVLVLPPDEPARAAIIRHHLAGRPTAGIDVAKVARRTDGYSGADLRLVCESAAEAALEASIASGVPRPINHADLERARAEVRPSTRPWFEVAKNYALFANEGGTYDDLLGYMRSNRLA